MRKALLLLTAAALPAAFLSSPAHADAVRYCVTTGRATFTDPLTAVRQQGVMRWEYDATCTVVDDGGASGIQFTSGTHYYDYDGSCVTAEMTGPTGEVSILVGGTQMVTESSTSTRTFARHWTFVSDNGNPCAMEGATVVQHGPDYYTP
ncbi:MAG TPA: hypothetical protein VNA20_12005 [Frankiaceae bacterium]|nr:hypothetical protein [Frankiaceae bacterium]